jgi:hypothetical protein
MGCCQNEPKVEEKTAGGCCGGMKMEPQSAAEGGCCGGGGMAKMKDDCCHENALIGFFKRLFGAKKSCCN